MMMMQHTNDKRLALQEKALQQLEDRYQRDMDALDELFLRTDMTKGEYARRIRELNRAFDEDYNDIFAG